MFDGVEDIGTFSSIYNSRGHLRTTRPVAGRVVGRGSFFNSKTRFKVLKVVTWFEKVVFPSSSLRYLFLINSWVMALFLLTYIISEVADVSRQNLESNPTICY